MDIVMVKLALVVLGALGLGLWQLWDVNRELKKHQEPEQTAHDDDA